MTKKTTVRTISGIRVKMGLLTPCPSYAGTSPMGAVARLTACQADVMVLGEGFREAGFALG
jgi:hypothetical protein